MKPHLVLLSGLLSDETIWQHQVRTLKEVASLKVISFRAEDTPEQMVNTILTQSPPQFALAGHSMGGWLALEIMRRAAHRVIKLCLLNTSARDDSFEKQQKRKQMIEECGSGRFKRIAEKINEHFVINSQVKQAVLNMFLKMGEKAFINQQKAMLARDECFSILPKISSPTLIIHASEDRNFSLEEHEELAQKIPGAKLAIIEDSGHMSPMEMPQAVTALLRFWLTYF